MEGKQFSPYLFRNYASSDEIERQKGGICEVSVCSLNINRAVICWRLPSISTLSWPWRSHVNVSIHGYIDFWHIKAFMHFSYFQTIPGRLCAEGETLPRGSYRPHFPPISPNAALLYWRAAMRPRPHSARISSAPSDNARSCSNHHKCRLPASKVTCRHGDSVTTVNWRMQRPMEASMVGACVPSPLFIPLFTTAIIVITAGPGTKRGQGSFLLEISFMDSW